MSSRARIFATVTLLIGCLAGPAAWAQPTNLEAGKSASQLFAGTCNACHKSPRGLLKTVSPGSLSGFLREHYTTSSDMASQLSSYLISNGASDTRQSKQGQDKQGSDKQGQGGADQVDRQGRKNRNAPAQEAARPDDATAPAEPGRQSRKRMGRQGEPEDARTPGQAAIERGPDGRRLKRGRPGQPGSEEAPMANEPAKTEPPKAESAKTEQGKAEPGVDDKPKAETPKPETAERAKPETEAKPSEAKVEAPMDTPKETSKDVGPADRPQVRRDPTPAVSPAPPPAASAPAPASAPAVAAGGSSEPAASQPKAPAVADPPALTASAPPAPPPPQAGPPAPPISQ
jgi:hypothetical protein